ncbi:MAG: HPr family phosphocarrier protein [Candidatus Izemoplasmatales bacterium]|mgnify:CR=1 FL=1|jgi:phosphocarrier protein|nr:HPr family phosphocarrier protein [Candidatus Izemoplasmatales bacterium]MDD4988095.1 HPr family phosphocarrier protein [Candidatus Izemoplasmatales bacterium]MDD5602355.1 HPr family phosphocarrier protein [Candidatus Izemoplasmatales bacterium]NLF48280.1 HPr family phosphocarrier protein [Acholeplasmataceae bacterium]
MEKTILIKSTAGLHAELAAKIVQSASKYDVDIKLIYEHVTIDAKSILGLMSLAVPQGKNVKLVATGDNADKAISEIEKILS